MSQHCLLVFNVYFNIKLKGIMLLLNFIYDKQMFRVLIGAYSRPSAM